MTSKCQYSDDDLVPIAALEHYSYCPRQCGLMYVECTFVDNVLTARGTVDHAHVDQPHHHAAGVTRVEMGLPLVSLSHGLTGKADVVEFDARATPYPVEYKHGRATRFQHPEIQLAAQALCLEEMFGAAVPEGAVFYVASQRRRAVAISPDLRATVDCVASNVRALLAACVVPPPLADAHCPNCSLVDLCLPYAVADRSRSRTYVRELFRGRAEAGES